MGIYLRDRSQESGLKNVEQHKTRLKLADNLTTENSGSALDARQGKILKDLIVETDNKIIETDNKFGELRFGIDSDGNYGYYKVGADTITPFKTEGGGGLQWSIWSMLNVVEYEVIE